MPADVKRQALTLANCCRRGLYFAQASRHVSIACVLPGNSLTVLDCRLSCSLDCLAVLGIAFGFYLATLLVRDPDYLATRDRIRMQAKSAEEKARSEKLKQKLYERTLGAKGLRALALQKLTKGSLSAAAPGSGASNGFQIMPSSYAAPQPAVYAGYSAQQHPAYGAPVQADYANYYGQQGY